MGSCMVKPTTPSDDRPASTLPEGWLPGGRLHPNDEPGRRLVERTARVFGYWPFFAQVNELRTDYVFRPLKEWEAKPEPEVTEETVQRFREALAHDDHGHEEAA